MSEMVERVAEAIWRAHPQQTPMKWSECTEEFLEVKRLEARAAIKAMREPTEAMVTAGRAETCEHGDMQCGADESWRAMIDEALK